MDPTILLYLTEPGTDTARSTVLSRQDGEGGAGILALDRTLFYPQGGGQPCDRGLIRGLTGECRVDEVRSADGIVSHFGSLSGTILPGEHVSMMLDRERRDLHSRLHSAGELLCAVMWNLGYGYPEWAVTSAIHYADRSSVAFGRTLPLERLEPLRCQIESEMSRLIRDDGDVLIQIVKSRAEAATLCGFVPDYLPENSSIRVVTVAGSRGRPCQGTHVQNLAKIGPVRITKVKSKKGGLTISYALESAQKQ